MATNENRRRRRFALAETVGGGLLLSAYGLILLSADPEWVVWAGQMTVGCLPLDAAPVSAAGDARESLRAAGSMSAVGLLVAAASFVLSRRRSVERLVRAVEHAWAWLCDGRDMVPRH